MGYLKNFVHLSADQFKELRLNGSITVDGITHTYNKDINEYVTPIETLVDLSNYVDLTGDQTITGKKTFDTVVEINDDVLLKDVQYLSSAIAWKASDSDWSNAHKLYFPAKTSTLATIEDIPDLLTKIFPIGSVYMSVVDNSPASFLGGTWEQIKDEFLLAAGDIYAAGSEGGSAEHTLTIDEIPSHKHQLENGVGVDWSDQGATTSPISFQSEISNGRNIDSKAVGGGLPHNNMPPYLAVYMWKRVA